MKIVNSFFLNDLLGPLVGLGDVDPIVEQYADFDSNDEVSVRGVIRELIVPHAQTLTDRNRALISVAYRYYLTTNSTDFKQEFEAILPPLDPPDDARLFYLWTWEECFPGESYLLPDADEYRVKHDPDETWQIHLT